MRSILTFWFLDFGDFGGATLIYVKETPPLVQEIGADWRGPQKKEEMILAYAKIMYNV